LQFGKRNRSFVLDSWWNTSMLRFARRSQCFWSHHIYNQIRNLNFLSKHHEKFVRNFSITNKARKRVIIFPQNNSPPDLFRVHQVEGSLKDTSKFVPENPQQSTNKIDDSQFVPENPQQIDDSQFVPENPQQRIDEITENQLEYSLYNSILEAAQDRDKDKLVHYHQQIIEKTIPSPSMLLKKVILTLLHNKNHSGAEQWFQLLGDRVWSNLGFISLGIQIYSRSGNFTKCEQFYAGRKNFKSTPDLVLYVVFLDACGHHKRTDLVEGVFKEILDKKIPTSTNLFTTIIEAYARNQEFFTSYHYFNAIPYMGLTRTAKTGRTLLSFMCSSYPDLEPTMQSLQGLHEEVVLSEEVLQTIKKAVERPHYQERFQLFMLQLFSGGSTKNPLL